MKTQKREIFANAVHKRGEWSKVRKQVYDLNLHLQKWFDPENFEYRAKHAGNGGVPS